MALNTLLLTLFLLVLVSCDYSQFLLHFTGDPPPKRVAIIGAGAAGSSTAYHLSQYARNASIPIDITVYERHDYVGGRSTTVPVYDDASLGVHVELGASIFVEVNRILADAVREFNLSVEEFGGARAGEDDGKQVLGIWNGEEFVFTQKMGAGSWWEDLLQKGKLLWRYGLAPVKTMNLMKNVTGRFFEMYEEPAFPWTAGLSQVVMDSGLLGTTALTGFQFLDVNGIGELFAKEIIQASTRVNYAQNLGLIHGLETMVCMASSDAMSVKGGNYQIFANMLKTSSATVHLSTDVYGIHKHSNGSYSISSTSTTTSPASTKNETFDTVVLAAPYHQSDIHFSSSASADALDTESTIPDDIPYVNLHVTLFASPYRLSPTAFNLAPSTNTPNVVLTTLLPEEQAQLGAATNSTNVGRAGFYSISMLRTAMNPKTQPPRREFVYKIFSPMDVSDEYVRYILDVDAAPVGESADKDIITWIKRHTWLSYPYLPPRVTFDDQKLDTDLWYTSGIEAFISTMETSALMGKNVARLIADEWAGESEVCAECEEEDEDDEGDEGVCLDWTAAMNAEKERQLQGRQGQHERDL